MLEEICHSFAARKRFYLFPVQRFALVDWWAGWYGECSLWIQVSKLESPCFLEENISEAEQSTNSVHVRLVNLYSLMIIAGANFETSFGVFSKTYKAFATQFCES
jgi:hypothetical protein